MSPGRRCLRPPQRARRLRRPSGDAVAVGDPAADRRDARQRNGAGRSSVRSRRRLGDQPADRHGRTIPAIAGVYVDQATQRVTIVGKSDRHDDDHDRGRARRFAATCPVRVAFYAGSVADRIVRFGSPAIPRRPTSCASRLSRAVRDAAQARPDAQVVVTRRRRSRSTALLEQDDVASFDVPVLIQGSGELRGRRLDPRRRAERRGSAHLARLADGQRLSRAPDGRRHALHRRSALRSSRRAFSTSTTIRRANRTGASSCARRISRASLRSCSSSAVAAARRRNEMDVGHTATKRFLVNVVQNQGRLLTLAGNSTTRHRRAGLAARQRRLQLAAAARPLGR